ncbi:MAG TPA: neuraminidase-like domain-containing protein [Pyrinomonadaceae bacterium]|nr:neuraminidase-like domain-containing protein [Pyrinomonadaceae bacterium]
MPKDVYEIRGQVIDQKTREGESGLRVQVWHRGPEKDDSLGEVLSGAEGYFAIEIDRAKVGTKKDALRDLYLKIFAGERLLRDSRKQPVPDWKPGTPLVVEVNRRPVPNEEEKKPYIVSGEVVKPDGAPLPNYPVKAFDRILCDWRLLGEARTDDLGRYQITYDPASLLSWGKNRADLKVEVRDPKAAAKVLAASPLILEALPQETANFVIGEGSYRGPDEYFRSQLALSPLLESLDNFSCLNVADVHILARDSKLPTSNVAYFLKAQRWSNELNLPPAVFYGLLRQHLPPRKDALFAQPFSRLWKKLQWANSQNFINVVLDDSLQNRLSEIQLRYLSQPDHPYRQLLETTGLKAKQQMVFTERLTKSTQTRADFWDTLETEAGFNTKQVAELQNTFELQSLTGNNTTLTVHLRKNLNLSHPREAAALSIDDWKEIMTAGKVEIPDDILPGGPEALRRSSYSQALYRTAEAQYPTPSLMGQMSRSRSWANRPESSFLKANPEFEFGKQRVTHFLQQNPKALNVFPEPETGKRDLLRLEQMFHLTPAEDKLTTIQPLWDAGIRSAPQIAFAGRRQLQSSVSDQLETPVVNQIYQNAVHSTATALNVYMLYQPQLNPSLYVLNTPKLPAGTVAGATTGLPEWSELFGSTDACECTHCQSALSPAAYLVDMMDFLQRATDSTSKNGLDHLLERRPDLGLLQLTCENTDTTLPQIDLVIEIMEQIVANSTDGTTLPATGKEQTTWTSDVLAAQPEHFLPAAYEKLQAAIYPFPQLPFSLWLTEGRRYLQQMGVTRDELMVAMPLQPTVDDVALGTEALGMSPLEREIITTPRSQAADIAPYWDIDLAGGSLVSQLSVVEILLKKAQIDYDTLLRLLNTRFLNPDRLITVSFTGAPCSLDGAELVGDGRRKFFDRSQRFIRLLTRLGWTEYDLDIAIRALYVNDFAGQKFIPKVAALQSLHKVLGVSISELSSWWVDLDTYVFEDGLVSQYEALFLNPAVFPNTYNGTGPDLRNAVFALTADRSDLAVTTSTDPTLSKWLAQSDGATEPTYLLQLDYAAIIQGATRLSTEDIALLVAEVLPKDTATGHVALNLANVSMLYRVASIARALKISVQDYLHLEKLTGLMALTTPGTTATPVNSLDLHTRFEEIQEANWAIDKLAYLLLHASGPAAIHAPQVEDMDAVLVELSAGLSGITDVATARDNLDLRIAITQALGSTLGVEAEVLEALLFTHRAVLGDDLLAHLIVAANPGMAAPPSSSQEFYAVFETLHKFSMAWKTLELDLDHLAFVIDQGQALGWTDIAAFPLTPQSGTDFEAWRRLTQAVGLQASIFSIEQSLFALLSEASSTTLTRDDFLVQTSEWTGWNLDDLIYLAGADAFDLTYPDDFQNEQWLVNFDQIFELLRRLGVSAARAHSWTHPNLTSIDAESIKQALKSNYDNDGWLEVMAVIQDELREHKRDALLSLILNNLSAEDSSDFYTHYFIDPEMDPCTLTSRIVEAHAAIQIFVQRILLNLEPSLSFPREDAEGWQWRKNYRVWEAARKVFLYPENWIEPELRDNKSTFFRELEDGLLQDDVNLETAERLYREYLHKLDQVSRLQIMGMYQDEDVNVLHVFGRTNVIPALYYYRRWEDNARWTPWERVELDIRGDHLTPIVYNGRLYLFWADFKTTKNVKDTSEIDQEIDETIRLIGDTERALEEVRPMWEGYPLNQDIDTHPLSFLLDDLNDQLAELEAQRAADIDEMPIYTNELGMAWSEYRDGKWEAKKISGKTTYTTDLPLSEHYFLGWVDGSNQLYISAHTQDLLGGDITVATFVLDSCQGEVVIDYSDVDSPEGEVSVEAADVIQNHLHHVSWIVPDDLTLQMADPPNSQPREILSSSPRNYFTYHYPHQYGIGGRETSPFFYADDRRAYFVKVVEQLASLRTFESLPVVQQARTRLTGNKRLEKTATTSQTVPGQAKATSHYQGLANNQIIDRAATGLQSKTTTANNDFIESILVEDGEMSAHPSEAVLQTELNYRFTRFYHPYTCLFLKQLSRYGVDGLLNPDPEWDDDSENLHRQLTPLSTFNFETSYSPTDWVAQSYPNEDIDFDHHSPYGSYNWELFFHVPLLIATRLMQNQRYVEARQWFHYVFDPTYTEGEAPARFWKTKPFYEEQLKGPTETLEELLDLLESGNEELEQQVEEWEQDPFQPHVVARLRITAYMQTTVMKYLDCLIGEADMLFTMDTRESIVEAAQLYLLAGEILGEKPTLLPAQEAVTYTPNDLLGRSNPSPARAQITKGNVPLDPLEILAAQLPNTLTVKPLIRSTPIVLPDIAAPSQGAMTSYGTLLLFCIPHNDKLYSYWDTVADRLFKIRHCMNIAGQVRHLPLFAPPIDPGLLVRASAAGLDIASIIGGLYAPLPHYRFSYMLQKALELCGEVRNLGSALTAVLEKQDGEELSLLRSSHEVSLLQSILELKRKGVEEAERNIESLQSTLSSAEYRRDYYKQKEFMNAAEIAGIALIGAGAVTQAAAQLTKTTSLPFYAVPESLAGGAGMSSPVALVVTSSWKQMTESTKGAGDILMILASILTTAGSISQTIGGYQQRKKDWDLQAELATKEIEQLEKQILAADIRRQIAEKDLENHEEQIVQAEGVEAFLKTKFTNQQLYIWMASELSKTYFQVYQMAYQIAKQAEKTFQHELGPDESSLTFIQPTYWDSLRKGLLAGEQLNHDLRRMETAHLEANRRELEITKHISLLQLDPAALLELRETGGCDIHIPEVLFDLDFPGHYFRRIKSARVTIPCVTGPYTSVSATLSLTGSWIRKAADTAAAAESVVTALPQMAIATSSGRDDSGTFELNFNDPRYLPFEGAGVVSSWRLELPSAVRSFDYDTITDLVIHLSYTARDGGDIFKQAVNGQLESALNDLKKLLNVNGVTLARLISLRQEFAADWNRFLSPATGETQQITLNLTKQHFPRYLDYLWQKNSEEQLESLPITLRITSVQAYLNPRGGMPTEDVSDIPGLVFFDSAIVSPSEITNESGAELTLTAGEVELKPEDWKDMYLLLQYEVAT